MSRRCPDKELMYKGCDVIRADMLECPETCSGPVTTKNHVTFFGRELPLFYTVIECGELAAATETTNVT